MFRVLVVDDEQIVLDAIKFMISKREDDVVVCGTASSGREAIEMTKSLVPDIVIMDIRMPGINGIEAIKEIKHYYPDIRFVIISAYEQFEFAKQAVQLGVKEYLLKPINRAKLNGVLNQIIGELESERQQKNRDLETMERLQNMMPFLENGFIYSIITNSDALHEMKKVIQLLDVKCDCGYLMILQFHSFAESRMVDNKNNAAHIDAFNTHLNLHEKADQLREIIKYKCNAIVGPLMINKMVIFVPSRGMENDYDARVEATNLAECLQSKIKEAFSIECSVGISSIVVLSELYYAYGQANKAINKTSSNEIYHIADLYEDYDASREKLKFQSQLIEALTHGRLEKALKYFDSLFELIREQHELVFELVVLIFRIANDEGIEENQMINYGTYLKEISQIEGDQALYQWIVARMKYISSQIQTKKDLKCCAMVERTKHHLTHHFTDELTLEAVARLQNVSPQYLSKVFKEETRSTFVEFLTRLRIEMAQKLMVESDKSVKEICYEVGYSDPNYFSRLFRKQTGVMPTEYIGQFRVRER